MNHGPVATAARRFTVILLVVTVIAFVSKCNEENYRPWPQPSSGSTR
jgi:hypothetical protein